MASRGYWLAVFLGVFLLFAGVYLSFNPTVTQRVASVPVSDVVFLGSLTVDARSMYPIPINVPPGASNPVLRVDANVDKDIILRVVTGAGERVYEERVAGMFSRSIPLLGGGYYELQLDNRGSLLTKKHVELTVALDYDKQIVENVEQASNLALAITSAGALIIIGTLIYILPKIIKQTMEEFKKGLKGK